MDFAEERVEERQNYLDLKIHRIVNLPPSWVSVLENGEPPLYRDHPFRYTIELVDLLDETQECAAEEAEEVQTTGSKGAAAQGDERQKRENERNGSSKNRNVKFTDNDAEKGKVAAAASPPAVAAEAATADQSECESLRHNHYCLCNGRLLQEIPLYKDYCDTVDIPFEVLKEDIADAPGELLPTSAGGHSRAEDALEEVAAQSESATTAVASATVTGPVSTKGASHKVHGGGTVSPEPPGDVPAGPPPPSSDILFALTPEAEALDLKEKVPTADKKREPKPKKGQPPPPVELVMLPVPDKSAPPPCIVRIPLTAYTTETLEGLLQAGKPLTLRLTRKLRSNAPADWEDQQAAKYEAHAFVCLAPLAEPGCTSFYAVVPLRPTLEPVKEDDKAKKRPAPKKGKSNAPALLVDEPELGERHPYILSGTSVEVSVKTRFAITRLPQSRPMPSLQPSDLIPRRVLAARRPPDASARLFAEVRALAQEIVVEYRTHTAGLDLSSCRDNVAMERVAREEFMSNLEASGKLAAIEARLAPIVQATVRERFSQIGQGGQEGLERLLNTLYVYLQEQLHSALNDLFASPAPVAVGDVPLVNECGERTSGAPSCGATGECPGVGAEPLEDAGMWRQLAAEAEFMRNYPLVMRHYQQHLWRVADDATRSKEVWCDYGEFLLRARDQILAEQAFKEALSLDITFTRVLIDYGLLLLSKNRLQQAEVFLQSAVDLDKSPLAWGCLALMYDLMATTCPDPEGNRARVEFCAHERSQSIRQACLAVGGGAELIEEVIYEMVGSRLVQLHLEDLANVALSKVKVEGFSLNLLLAQIAVQTEEYDEADRLLRRTLDSASLTSAQECEMRILLADALARCGQNVEAEALYCVALRADPHCCSASSLLQLGNIYIALGRFKDALATLLLATESWPCGLTWLGVGIAYLRLGDFRRAEQSLNESNILNNLNPKTWGYLALLCIKQGKDAGARIAYQQAVKLRLADADLIAEIGSLYFTQGSYKESEQILRHALELDDTSKMHLHLARTLAAEGLYEEAAKECRRTIEGNPSQIEKCKAEAILEEVK